MTIEESYGAYEFGDSSESDSIEEQGYGGATDSDTLGQGRVLRVKSFSLRVIQEVRGNTLHTRSKTKITTTAVEQ